MPGRLFWPPQIPSNPSGTKIRQSSKTYSCLTLCYLGLYSSVTFYNKYWTVLVSMIYVRLIWQVWLDISYSWSTRWNLWSPVSSPFGFFVLQKSRRRSRRINGTFLLIWYKYANNFTFVFSFCKCQNNHTKKKDSILMGVLFYRTIIY